MKALLLIEDDDKALEVERHIKPLGFEAVRYRNPIKALDNLDEISPDAIIASALDFPRHWKIITDVVRSAKDRHECVIVLLRGEHFGVDEAAKATFLGVNGVVSERLAEPAEKARLLRLLRRYTTITDAREEERLPAPPWERIVFLFCHPVTTRILGGKVQTISGGGLSIDFPIGLAPELDRGTVLDDCSLRIGEVLVRPRCAIVRRDSTLGLSFIELSDEEQRMLESYLEGFTSREIRARSLSDVDKF